MYFYVQNALSSMRQIWWFSACFISDSTEPLSVKSEYCACVGRLIADDWVISARVISASHRIEVELNRFKEKDTRLVRSNGICLV
jgi:hypothetical protein